MDQTEAMVEAHNRTELWKDAENHLRIARESLEQAQSALDDLEVPHISANLTPTIESVEGFRELAEDYVSLRKSDPERREES